MCTGRSQLCGLLSLLFAPLFPFPLPPPLPPLLSAQRFFHVGSAVPIPVQPTTTTTSLFSFHDSFSSSIHQLHEQHTTHTQHTHTTQNNTQNTHTQMYKQKTKTICQYCNNRKWDHKKQNQPYLERPTTRFSPCLKTHLQTKLQVWT